MEVWALHWFLGSGLHLCLGTSRPAGTSAFRFLSWSPPSQHPPAIFSSLGTQFTPDSRLQGLLSCRGDVTKVHRVATFPREAGSTVRGSPLAAGACARGVRELGGWGCGRGLCACCRLSLRWRRCRVLGFFQGFDFRKLFCRLRTKEKRGPVCAVGGNPASCRGYSLP